MNVRRWAGVVAGAVLVGTTMLAGSSASAADHAHRLTGDDAAHATAARMVARTAPGTAAGTAADTAATTAIVAMPDLGIAHRLAGGGMNLWRLPLSEFDPNYGRPKLVKTLDYGGFSFDRSVVLAGDVADVTPSDDGSADFVIWHAQPNGGVLVWAVGGGPDTTPRLWMDLRTGGWSYDNSTPMLADVNGDGWEDLVVRHRIVGTAVDNVWVFPSDGQKLGPPTLWGQVGHQVNSRQLMADVDGDGMSNMVLVDEWGPPWAHELDYTSSQSPVTPDPLAGDFNGLSVLFQGPASAGWSWAGSRQLAGDVTGDGMDDLVTVHAQAGGGMLVWVHRNCGQVYGCLDAPQVWQDLKTGGWSFAGSRQYLADTNGDGLDDLVSVHSQGGNPGELVWRALSTGSGFAAPQIVADLKTGGWSYLNSRESVARLYGQVTY